jgi:pimeloyl-ACP methyl ester carboxylesterase
MVHGGAQGSAVGGERNFSAQKPLAERGWQLIVPDRPGHGQSPNPGRPDDAEADGAWVAELVGDGAHLVGHSFGGCVALAAAAKRPAVVRSLTLIEPGMLKFATSNPHVKRFVFRLLLTTLFSPSAVRRAERFANLIGLPPEIRGRYDREELKRVGRSLARGKIPSKSAIARELTETKRAEIPLLVVTGGWSPAFEATGDMVAAAGGGHRVVIKSGHHFPHLMSDEFNQILTVFLEKSDARQKA